ncbi:MAG: carboxypeptidase M32 [Chloroflexota bacterium]|nr:carboxypeptidase M32 [Chloroflexota bacterium]
MMGEQYQALVKHLADVRNLNRAQALLDWDQQVNMPPGGAAARASQMGTLSRIGHELFTSDTTARLLENAAAELNGTMYDSDEASMIRVVRHDYAERTRIPSELVEQMTQARAMAHHAWVKARAENDFAAFAPYMERNLELTIRSAEYLGYAEHPYDALVGSYERGMTARRVQEIFDGHRAELVELIANIRKHADRADDSMLKGQFEIAKQRDFALDIIKYFGFDFARGRQDVSAHPFAIRFSRGDTRITTRFNEHDLRPSLFGTMHEAGHALYEQGIAPEIDGTMLGWGTSLGVHESQSRLWENLVGRSLGFWKWALPKLAAVFPEFDGIDPVQFYRAINTVQLPNATAGYIRVEADEATYNLHIMLRYDLEMGLVSGAIKVADLPREWNDRFEAYFGATPPTAALGVLQDVHWSSGLIGYFPTYAIGNLLSTQYYTAACRAHPSIPDEIENGQFDNLRNWMSDNIYRHGRKFTSDELTMRVTGDCIQCGDFIVYLQTKYGDIYDL